MNIFNSSNIPSKPWYPATSSIRDWPRCFPTEEWSLNLFEYEKK